MLVSPDPGEILFIYLAMCEGAISALLLKEEEKFQKPNYFVSKALHGAELRYSNVEKIILALVHASRKLKPYFQSHPIHVITDQLLKQILNRP